MKNVAELTGTRERVLSLLLDLGPSTAAVLGERLALSPAAVRRHLDALLSDGTVTTREARPQGLRGRGRPARLYALSDAGHAAGPSGYDDLAASALRYLAEQAGPAAVDAFARARTVEMEQRWSALAATDPAQRPAALAAAMSQDGYAASTSEQGAGVQLCQHHCPVRHVAEQFPQLCDAETAAISRLLDVHVQRLATIAHGDGVCTTFIPTAPAGSIPTASAGSIPTASAGQHRAAPAPRPTEISTGKAHP